MPKVLIIYDSRTGNTEKMAKSIAVGVKASRVEAEIRKVDEVTLTELKNLDGLIVGSPTYFGSMTGKMKDFFDKSVKIRGALEDKVGAAFTSSGSISGGNETTLLSIIQAMLIHGMLVAGDPLETGGHYGTVAVGKPDRESLKLCKKLGTRVARLVKKIAGNAKP